MKALENLEIACIENKDLREKIQYKLDHKTKPQGALGRLEEIAMQIGLIQNTTTPRLNKPVMLTIASDHDICDEGVSIAPQEVTWQQVLNFINGGGGIGLFCKLYGFELFVVDAGVDKDLSMALAQNSHLIDMKVRRGTRNFLHEHAMTDQECEKAISNGRKLIKDLANKGTNVVGFGEMGIGNTSPATALLSVFTGLSIEDCVGPGSGLNNTQMKHKADVLKAAIAKHGISEKPEENLARFGGLEIATMTGAMLEAAARKMLILVDGYITTSAFLTAFEINPLVREFAIFSHRSNEHAHIKMLEHMNAKALFNLDLRLGEGTGAALAYPIVQGAMAVINDLTSFKASNVCDYIK